MVNKLRFGKERRNDITTMLSQKNSKIIYNYKKGVLASFQYILEDWGQEEKGTTEDEMAGWHH